MSGKDVLTLGSLFAGIGGIELGLEMTGRFKTVWQVEKDAYCRKVLAKHWPKVTRFEDVKDVGKENLAAVDVICGGFPCQDISNAGRKAGIVEGNRSGLWHEYVRIIRELRPSYVVVENVSALLVRGLDVVLGELAESGYDAEWSMLSAADIGAPHLRQRIFVVGRNTHCSNDQALGRIRRGQNTIPRRVRETMAHAPSERCREARPSGERSSQRISRRGALLANTNSAGQPALQGLCSILQCARHRTIGGGSVACGGHPGWSVEPNVGRVANGVPSRVDRLRALGNAVVPQCARVVGEWLLEIHDELTAVA